MRIIPGSDFLPAIWRIETNFVKSQEDKWGGWKAKRWIYDKKAPDMLPWIQLDLIKNAKHFRYHDTKHPMISTTTFDPKTPGEHKRINHFLCNLRSLTKSFAISFYPFPQTCWDTRRFQKLPLPIIWNVSEWKKWTETWCALRAWRLLRRWQYQPLWCPRCPCRWFPCPSRCPCRWYRAPRRSSL